jgi:hypothetical protein
MEQTMGIATKAVKMIIIGLFNKVRLGTIQNAQ